MKSLRVWVLLTLPSSVQNKFITPTVSVVYIPMIIVNSNDVCFESGLNIIEYIVIIIIIQIRAQYIMINNHVVYIHQYQDHAKHNCINNIHYHAKCK